MNEVTRERMALIFNEWVSDWKKDNPDDPYGDTLIVPEYGYNAADHFNEIAEWMDKEDLLPKAEE